MCKNVQKSSCPRALLACKDDERGTDRQKAMNEKTLNIKQLAAYIGVSRRTLYNMLSDGRLPVAPIPGTKPRRWSIDDLDRWREGKQ